MKLPKIPNPSFSISYSKEQKKIIVCMGIKTAIVVGLIFLTGLITAYKTGVLLKVLDKFLK